MGWTLGEEAGEEAGSPREEEAPLREARKDARQETQGLHVPPPSPLFKASTPTPRALFAELHELYVPCSQAGEMEWRETGRWIRYAESVEVGAERWGAPHVPSLSFSALIQLQELMGTGFVSLGLPATNALSLTEAIVAGLHEMGTIKPEDRPLVFRSLLLPHRHVGSRARAVIHSSESYNSLQDFFYRQQVVPETPRTNLPRASSRKLQRNESVLMPTIRSEHSIGGDSRHLQQRKLSQVPVPLTSPAELRQLSQASPQKTPGLNGSPVKDILLRTDTGGWLHRLRRCFRDKRRKARRHKEAVASAVEAQPISSQAMELLRILPDDAEVALVMVGAVEFLDEPVMALVRLDKAIPLPSATEVPLPTRFVFLLLGPLNAGLDYHEIGRSVGTLMANKDFRSAAYRARETEDMREAIGEFLDDSIVLPPWKWEGEELLPINEIKTKLAWLRQRSKAKGRRASSTHGDLGLDQPHFTSRTGRLFGRLRQEVVHRFRHYPSDVTDVWGWHSAKSVLINFLSFLFLAVTFGAILRKKTKGTLGVREALVSTSLCGTLFALLGAQPMMVLGLTGPMLMFEESLFRFTWWLSPAGLKLSEQFLTMRFWASCWALLFCVLTAAFEGSWLIGYVTRFSDDILLSLVSFIFIMESASYAAKVFKDHPIAHLDYYCNQSDASAYFDPGYKLLSNVASNLSDYPSKAEKAFSFNYSNLPNVAYLCVIFVVGTALLAFYVDRVKDSRLFGRTVREVMGDFSLSIAVIVFVLIDSLVLPNDDGTGKVQLGSERLSHWYPVGPMGLSAAGMWSSFLPGLFLFAILFLENLVVEVDLAKPEAGLRKGRGDEWNFVLSGALLVLCAAGGLPWVCAAPVRTAALVDSLSVWEPHAPGERPRKAFVTEQRVTPALLHLLLGLPLLYPAWIPSVPVAVLFGVFLYLGLRNLAKIQMLGRALLFFVPLKHHPSALYCLRVEKWRMHLFTAIQLLCFAAVCGVKSLPSVAFAFPLLIGLTCLLRHALLPKLFSHVELLALDAH